MTHSLRLNDWRSPAVAVLTTLVCLTTLACGGCGWLHPHQGVSLPPGTQLENPLFVGISDEEFVWDQIVDSVDDHFTIEREERMRRLGDVLTEGRLYTFP